MRKLVLSVAALALGVAAGAPSAHAQWVRNGRLDDAVARGDDNFESRSLGFSMSYYGRRSDQTVVCTNGLAIFGDLAPGGTCVYPGVFGQFQDGTPYPRVSDLPNFYGSVMAPFYSDLRTNFGSGPPGGQVFTSTRRIGNREAFTATWDGVRGYGGTPGQSVTFQLALISLSRNHYVMEFNYGALDFGAEGGIGFGDDGAYTGDMFTAEPILAGGTRPSDSRFTCRFVGGVATRCGVNVSLVPEPATVALVGGGLALLGAAGARRRRAA